MKMICFYEGKFRHKNRNAHFLVRESEPNEICKIILYFIKIIFCVST